MNCPVTLNNPKGRLRLEEAPGQISEVAPELKCMIPMDPANGICKLTSVIDGEFWNIL